MTKGQKITIGCFSALLIFVVVCYFVLHWLKQKVVTTVAEGVQIIAVDEINKSPLPDSQKEAFVVAVDDILGQVANGEIDFNFNGTLADKPKAVKIISEALKKAVNKFDIEESQKQEINSQIDRLGQAFASEQINEQQFGDIAEDLFTGQFGTLLALWAVEANYFHGSGLSQEEKDAANVILRRLAQGLKSKKLTQSDIDKLTDPYSETDVNGDKKLKADLSDEELKELMKSSNELLTEKQVAEEPMKFEIGKELKEALDAAEVPE